MKHISILRILCGVLTLTALCMFARADTREPAPQFTARTLDGETLTNASLSGKVVLLQFWATWCPYCRRDQSTLDKMEHMFSDKGLVVLAVDVGESETTVRNYLQANPRSCRIVLNEGSNIAREFGAHSFPYYVLLDRAGNIVGTQNGSGGEASLRHLLSRAGLSSRSETRDGDGVASAPAIAAKSRVIEAPRASSYAPVKPVPKTIFVMANGERLESDHYTLDASSLHVTVNGQQRTIPLSELNMNATMAVNHQRGIDLKIPKSRSEMVLAF